MYFENFSSKHSIFADIAPIGSANNDNADVTDIEAYYFSESNIRLYSNT